MSTANALSALKTILTDMDVDGYDAPAVYLLEDLTANLTPPFIVIDEANDTWLSVKPYGAITHEWMADIRLCLHKGTVNTISERVTLEEMRVAYFDAITLLLTNNRGLNGQVVATGSNDELFRYRTEYMQVGYPAKPFWGVRFNLPVTQMQGC